MSHLTMQSCRRRLRGRYGRYKVDKYIDSQLDFGSKKIGTIMPLLNRSRRGSFANGFGWFWPLVAESFICRKYS
jgi:hypothetical protein